MDLLLKLYVLSAFFVSVPVLIARLQSGVPADGELSLEAEAVAYFLSVWLWPAAVLWLAGKLFGRLFAGFGELSVWAWNKLTPDDEPDRQIDPDERLRRLDPQLADDLDI